MPERKLKKPLVPANWEQTARRIARSEFPPEGRGIGAAQWEVLEAFDLPCPVFCRTTARERAAVSSAFVAVVDEFRLHGYKT